MWSWALVAVPASIGAVLGLLLLVSWLEEHVLSPRAVIRWAVRVRNSPEHAERVVRVEAERLLGAPPTGV